jgi:hypothetical protein
MSDWKAEAIKKKDYRRGGIEPDPPKKAKSKKPPKIYKVEYKWDSNLFGSDDWWGWNSYRELSLAYDNIEKMKRESDPYRVGDCHYKAFRIINKKTKEVIYLEER